MKKLLALMLSGCLLCGMAIPVYASSASEMLQEGDSPESEEVDLFDEALELIYETEKEIADTIGAYTRYADLSYCDHEGTSYDLYVPDGLDKTKNQYLILFIHGGGYTGGDKQEQHKRAEFFANQGYVVANVNYTVLTEQHPETNINYMDNEIKLCVTAVKKKCKKMGIKLTGMATSGSSAGGGLSLLYAFRHQDDSPIPIKFVFEQTGPATFHYEDWMADEEDRSVEGKREWTELLTGKKVTNKMVKDGTADRYLKEISPIDYVDSDTVPCLLAYGGVDYVVPTRLGKKLNRKLNKYQVPHDYVYFKYSGHLLALNPDKTGEFWQLALQYCRYYFIY